jgi:hypothetical protein
MCESDDKFSELRITRAYISLLSAPTGKHGGRSISLVRFGKYEVRMTDISQIFSTDTPLFWLELFDHDLKLTVDSCQCHEFEEAATVLKDLVLQAENRQ